MDCSHDKLYEVLGNTQQKRILVELLENGPQIDVEQELVTATPINPIECRHHHLPKLDSYGLIEWDPDDRRIERGPAFPAVEPMVEQVRNWSPADR